MSGWKIKDSATRSFIKFFRNIHNEQVKQNTMADDLPDEFDLVVAGTGFTESCVAAAASRIGKTVLHIDASEHYGGAWASFSLTSLESLFDKTNIDCNIIQNATRRWHVPFDDNKSNEKLTWTRTKILEQSRRFNIDLCPKVLYSSGKLVQLLIKSNICRYAEFRAVDRVCTRHNNQIINVPCSRSDVFSTRDLHVLEKRMLMKFLTLCIDYDKNNETMHEYHDQPFIDFLRAQGVTDKIASCVIQAIAMCNLDTSFEEGTERTQKFLKSLGRYGNTPFLFPMYGCGEIPQCFCRLCAVFGGVYCLKSGINQVDLNRVTNTLEIEIGNKKIRAKHLVCSDVSIPSGLTAEDVIGWGPKRAQLSRGIFICDAPLGSPELNTGGGGVNIMRLLADFNREAFLIQLSHYSGTCPEGLYMIHITTPAISCNPAHDISCFASQVFHVESPKILYAAYFTLSACSPFTATSQQTPSSITAADTKCIFCTDGPSYELDYDLSIENAEYIFSLLYPTEEFLPRAPDPEEIVIDGENPSDLNEHSLAEDLKEQLHTLESDVQNMNTSAKQSMQMQEQSTEAQQQEQEMNTNADP